MKRYHYFSAAAAVLVLLSGCKEGAGPSNEIIFDDTVKKVNAEAVRAEGSDVAKAEMIDTNGERIGTVTFHEKDKAVLAEAVFQTGIPQGFHGFHIHETGTCEPDAAGGAFSTAGSHYNPDGGTHGEHAGDMPVIYGLGDGSAYMYTALDKIDARRLANEQRAVIVHSASDNYANIPDRYQSNDQQQPGPDEETLSTGDSGNRISCGVIKSK
ncbi:superoxide dismutase family protein [Alteribacillus sp. HJP-4]|uniref:superoxide dismutase family protein n=1 Tax=Alteribacillus sp. HJP-4 TaxID=2775394 RepID=UPI0035CCF705